MPPSATSEGPLRGRLLLLGLSGLLLALGLSGCGEGSCADADADGVCDSRDLCAAADDAADADLDGVCDAIDACPGGDDSADADTDGIPDFCDICPTDAANDSDGDGVCDSVDACPGGDDALDGDMDGVADFCDACAGADDAIDRDLDAIPDACDEAEYVFLTSSNGSAGFYRYTVASDSWDTVAAPPDVSSTQITNDGTLVYLLGEDNVIYQYTPGTDAWATLMAGPSPSAASSIGFFQWFDGGFYYLKDASSTLFVYRDAMWSSYTIPVSGSSAGDWDAVNKRLYIRTYSQLGYVVIDTDTDMVVDQVDDATSVNENSRSGSYSSGNFYTRTWDGPLISFDVSTGMSTDTMATPVSDHTGTATDHNSGPIYISGYSSAGTSFQVFDPATNMITTLADQPSVTNHSTITALR